MESPLKRKHQQEGSDVSKKFRPAEEHPTDVIRVGSRKSQLAVIQTKSIIKALEDRNPELSFEMETMDTLGDKILDIALPKFGEKSLFTKDLEIALQEKRIDFLVHSLKDLPTTMPEGMALATIYKRDDPHDCVIFHPKHKGKKLADLPEKSVIGTSSLRRVAQLKRAYGHLEFKSIRGNLNTRLRKLEKDSEYDAIVLAKAGIDRMKWGDKVDQVLTEDECLYAIGQGAMAVEVRSDDKYTSNLLGQLSDIPSLLICLAERTFMRVLNGGCSTPVGCYAKLGDNELSLHGVVLNEDGSICLEHTLKAEIKTNIPTVEGVENSFEMSKSGVFVDSRYMDELIKAEKLGEDLAFALKELGADEVLRDVRANLPKVTNIQIPMSGILKL